MGQWEPCVMGFNECHCHAKKWYVQDSSGEQNALNDIYCLNLSLLSHPCRWWTLSVRCHTAPGCWWWTETRMTCSAAVAWPAQRTWPLRWGPSPRAPHRGPPLPPLPCREGAHPRHPNPTTHSHFTPLLQSHPQTRPHKARPRDPQWHQVQAQTQR